MIGLKGGGGDAFTKFAERPKMSKYIGLELMQKIKNPLIFRGSILASRILHGYDITILIDVCNAILQGVQDGTFKDSDAVVKQARIITGASAKLGIKELVYKLCGYESTREEAIESFKIFIQEIAREYEQEFPRILYDEWLRMYSLEKPQRGWPWDIKHLTIKHVYYPLAKSQGKILELLRITKMQESKDKNKKLFQFLSTIGNKALRQHLGTLVGFAFKSSSDEYEAKVIEKYGSFSDQEEVFARGEYSKRNKE